MKAYFKDLIETVTDSLESLDDATFDLLVGESFDTLQRGNRIVVSGLGKNVPICDKFVGTMNSLGLDAVYMNTNSAVHGDLGLVRDGDLVIILTKSGETVESVYLNGLLKSRDCTRWLITFTEDCPMADDVDHTLCLSLRHEGDQWNIVPNNSTTVNLIVLQALAITLSKRMGVTLDDFKKNHPGGHIGEQLSAR